MRNSIKSDENGVTKDERKWIEIIRVRSTANTLEGALPSLSILINEIEETKNGAETFFMQHALYDGDLAIVVVWRNDTKPQKTREGLILAQRLQNLGSIDHAVWIPAGFK